MSEPPERRRRSGSFRWPTVAASALILAFSFVIVGWASGSGNAASDLAPIALESLSDAGEALDAEEGRSEASSRVWEATLLVLLFTLFNAALVAGDTALDLLRPARVRDEQDADRRRVLERLYQDREANVAACATGSQAMRALLVLVAFLPAPGLAALLFPAVSDLRVLLAAALIMLPIAALNLVVGELVPKSLAAAEPGVAVWRLRHPIAAARVLFALPSAIAVRLGDLVTRRVGANATFAVVNSAEDEIRGMVEEAEASGHLEEEASHMLSSVFELREADAREIMTPRVDMVTVDADASLSELADVVQESGHSRLPVLATDDAAGNVLGLVHAKDVLHALAHSPSAVARDLMRAPKLLEEQTTASEMLKALRAERQQMAIVVDDLGVTVGLVTVEDIVEEIVGEIEDEYDQAEEDRPDEMIRKVSRGWIVAGKCGLDDFAEEIEERLESEQFETIGGFVFGLFGYQPKQGESIQHGDLRFTVTDTDGRRIGRLLAERLAVETTEPSSEKAEA